MKIDAVIGAGYGDEGKGLLTDYLVSPSSLVVRYNGGAQAGHTVVTPQGQRHVFKHIGAGTFRGASTLLSRFFIVNPILFNRERALFPNARIYVDSRGMVTTPYDMLLNQGVENSRGSSRHGSVGLGINETVTRHLSGIELTVGNLSNARKILQTIRDDYYPVRARQLGITPIVEEDFIEKFILEIEQFLREIEIVTDIEIIRNQTHVVFEGAQGLKLDELAPDFPHVTRSRTGSPNVIVLSQESGISEINLHYVSRAYLTRHGNGPLRGEVDGHPYGWAGPETNRDHEYQGKFRYAKLNSDVLMKDISRDAMHWVGTGITTKPTITLTCLDQMSVSEAVEIIRRINMPIGYAAFGPTRNTIKKEMSDGLHHYRRQAS